MSAATPLLEIDNLVVEIQSMPALRGFSMRLPRGAMVSLVGRNGAGKTTLMRSIMGLLPARSGTMQFDDADLVRGRAYHRTRLGIGYMPEDRRLIPDLTVEENVLVPAWAMSTAHGPERLKKIYAMIPEIEAFASRKALQLSGGQQKLVAIGRALMAGTKLLLLDEPFEGVAPALSKRIAEVIADLKHEGLSVLVSESGLQHSEGMLDLAFRIERGEVSAA